MTSDRRSATYRHKLKTHGRNNRSKGGLEIERLLTEVERNSNDIYIKWLARELHDLLKELEEKGVIDK